ncbi:hypothetical protein NtRootA4_42020 (plasmid) [Arthrobacter sp. NtRootA4]|nr:hypothetical protein NtRootA2_41750 [Arthrobacter sp. NtRootA2]BCW17223.1 hypothetical protein NtRootA4_42020 [Arthrobacter sp. NtRootA4]BCW25331.1 hypothetical protein NtRootC7_41980 [Arthrobacter sp. NtRootC7]BCW29534.1 hypothetical protein NtRootC45_41340 [Arthrobacter sp. NtRootC45]BCW33931.1 hypothetical protein NtRootD5_42620 [Arthrobacter sp. NtRootD5]GGV41130.1 hypothetical protein GCM10010212_32510 [Paenarthrobacter nicotinovorans]
MGQGTTQGPPIPNLGMGYVATSCRHHWQVLGNGRRIYDCCMGDHRPEADVVSDFFQSSQARNVPEVYNDGRLG